MIKKIFILIFLVSTAYAQQQRTQQQIQTERLLSLARSYEQLGQFARALEIYQRLWRDEPQNVVYYRGVKQNLTNLKQFDQALAAVQQMLVTNPSPLIEADLGDAYYKLGQVEQALSAWNAMIQKNPKNPSIYQIVAAAMISNRLYDEAIKVYEKGRSTMKDHHLFILELANLHQARMDYEKAIALYLDYLGLYPEQYSFVEQSITNLADEPELIPQIERLLMQKIKENSSNIALRNLLASFYMRSSNYQAAMEEFSLIDEYLVTRPERDKQKIGNQLFTFAQGAFNDGKYQFAAQAYQMLLTRYPDSPYAANAKYGLANAYEKLGDFTSAVLIYQEIINTLKNSPLAKQSLYRIGVIKLDHFSVPEEAEGYFQNVLKNPGQPELNFEAMFRIGDCYIMRGLLDQAKNWYNQMAARYRGNDDVEKRALLEIGKIDYWNGNFDAALKSFSQIKSEPVNITDDKAGFYVNDAIDFVLFIEENKGSPEWLKKFATASLLIEQKQYEKALKIFYEIAQNSNAETLLDDAWLRIGQLEYQLGRYQQALSAFQTLIQKQPQSVHCDLAQKMIGEIYEVGLKEYSKAQQAYEVVLASYPNSVFLEEVRKRIRGLERGNKVIR
ncbi:MAG: tetratricopeptide repeat protein [candidate division KSB1 bacterium]|nr:tetratricopeptide repeat protein [candidate division KSB1 bacterium]MDZ7336568.1 tetratricopeptide repeat protein [candidate division KSB1 bacterium]MDZ7358923.1 tetratricopeptide repeat protein [candidate division KSB1 bacterium]MDZ7402370.1 tetratricopeptide repeat protein [candidate division KSB1 bacterium]